MPVHFSHVQGLHGVPLSSWHFRLTYLLAPTSSCFFSGTLVRVSCPHFLT